MKFCKFLLRTPSVSSCFFLFLSVNVPLQFAKLSLFNTAKIYTLKLESKAEAANTTFTIHYLNFGAVWLTITALFILRIGKYLQTPNEIMTNKDKNKNRNHINIVVSRFIHYMANLLGWNGEKWVTFAPFFK